MDPNAGNSRREGMLGSLGIPTAGLAALPACPACYPAYAGILSSLGLTALANPSAQAALTLLFLGLSLAALAYRARCRRGYGPLALGVAASVVVFGAKFALGWDSATYAGIALLVGAALWNVWPRKAMAALEKPAGLANLLLSLLLTTSLLSGCGAIEAPSGVTDMRDNPSAFPTQFDREVGIPRLVLLLSPA